MQVFASGVTMKDTLLASARVESHETAGLPLARPHSVRFPTLSPYPLSKSIKLLFAGIALFSLALMLLIWANNLTFPLNLEVMEGNILQHVQRLANGQYIYVEPSADYVALDYNPLYYYIALPFTWLFGLKLSTLRLVAVLAGLGAVAVIYRAVVEETRSRWWGWMAVGLFAAAHWVMDNYLHTAHSDSWLLFLALLGTYAINRKSSRLWNIIGVLCLVGAFWAKQHGAIFVIGGLLYLTWRDGIRRSLIYYAIAFVLGAVIFLLLGESLFGPAFHYFTWDVPRQWTALTEFGIVHFIRIIVVRYPVLMLASGWMVIWSALRQRRQINAWCFQLPFALLTGFMGTLDIGSGSNVLVSMGTWLILVGVIGLHTAWTHGNFIRRFHLHYVALALCFALFFYNYRPLNLLTPSSASASYNDLVTMLEGLDGQVFAPDIVAFNDNRYALYPSVGWVALEDLVRGPGRVTSNHPRIKEILAPLTNPDKPSYVLTSNELTPDSLFGFLLEDYVLVEDFQDRFKPLSPSLRSIRVNWPRYLYQYVP